MTLQPGTIFAEYRIERLLGVGGMAAVYLARHPRLPRSVALKILQQQAGVDDSFRARFEREAELAVRLDHPNVIEIYDRGIDNGMPWISMRYVAGLDAKKLIGHGPRVLPPHRAVGIIAQAAEGLDAAHRRGLLHRDVKPANILVTETDDGRDQVFVTDFGIARPIEDATSLTTPGSLIGTLSYIAPEQIEGRTVDHRADIYALGCTLYEMLTGAVPFAKPSAAAVVRAHLTEPPPRPSRTVRSLPTAIDAVIATAMAKDPDQRFSSCRELAAAATRALEPPPATTLPAPAPPASFRMATITALVAVVAIVITTIVLVRSFGSSTIEGTPARPPSTAATTTPTATAATTTRPITAWGRNGDLVALFLRLVGPEPGSPGYHDARCTDLDVLNNGGAPALECTQDNGIHWYIWSFRPGDPRRDATFTTKIENATTRQESWTRPSGTGSVRWSHYTEAGTGLLTVAFDDPARAWVVIDLEWPGHSGQDIVDQWWLTAPI